MNKGVYIIIWAL